jgi:C-5 cytosine-specific DNA methylase
MANKPLAIDLYAGLGGWTEGLLAEGWDVIGFDIERHDYGTGGYPGQLVLMDVCQIHGAMFKDADLIVASPPCQEFSYRAMPWKRAKALPPPILGTNLFWQCWRIQHEACEAAGRYIPMVVENVRGAQKWVGRAQAEYGSFMLWGDVRRIGRRIVKAEQPRFGMEAVAAMAAQKNTGGSWFGQRDGKPLERNDPRDMRKNESGEFVNASANGGWNHPGKSLDGSKHGGDWFSGTGTANGMDKSPMRQHSSRSKARKAASAQIAKIPEPLARHIARIFKP